MHRNLSALVFAIVLAIAAAPGQAQKARDLSRLRPCEVVTGKEVASIARGKLLSNPLGGASACTYLIELPDGQVESYGLSLQPAALTEAMLKAQSPAERGERAPGLWDEA